MKKKYGGSLEEGEKEEEEDRGVCPFMGFPPMPLTPSPCHVLLLLTLVFFFFFLNNGSFASSSVLNYTSSPKRVSALRLERIQKHLEKINKPAVRTIESPDGDIIDCVHRHRQPALDHPLLKNHEIQTVPPSRPRPSGGQGGRWTNYSESGNPRRGWQAWHHAGHCPRDTVPIRRSSVGDVLRAKSLYHYGKKTRNVLYKSPLARRVDAPDVVSGNGHEIGYRCWWV